MGEGRAEDDDADDFDFGFSLDRDDREDEGSVRDPALDRDWDLADDGDRGTSFMPMRSRYRRSKEGSHIRRQYIIKCGNAMVRR